MLRRPLLWLSLGCLLVLAGGLGYFLVTFDPNTYRTVLEQRLEKQFSLPARIGNIGIRFQGWFLAVHGQNIQLGGQTSELQASVADLWLELPWTSLLGGKLRVRSLTCANPVLQLSLDDDEIPTTEQKQDDQAVQALRALSGLVPIQHLELKDGLLKLTRFKAGKRSLYQFSNLQGTLNHLGGEKPLALAIQGDFQPAENLTPSPFSLQARLDPISETRDQWPAWNTALTTEHLDLPAVLGLWVAAPTWLKLHGQADLVLSIKATPEKLITFHIELAGQNLSLDNLGTSPEPVSLAKVSATGQWQAQGDQHTLGNLVLIIDQAQLAGSATWKNAADREIQITLDQGTLPVSALLPWLPEKTREWLSTLDPHKGRIVLDHGQLSGIKQQGTERRQWSVQTLNGALRELSWTSAGETDSQLTAVSFAYAGRQLRITGGELLIGTLPLSFAGDVDLRNLAVPRLDIKLHSKMTAPRIATLWPELPASWAIAGEAPMQGQITGPADALRFDLTAGLQQASLRYQSQLSLHPEQGDHLQLHGSVNPERLVIEHAALQWSGLQGQANGTIPFTTPEALALEGQLRLPRLSDLGGMVPRWQNLKLHGEVELSVSHKGRLSDHPLQAVLFLRDVGIETGGLIADLSRINGRLLMTDQELVATQLRADLGSSPLSVDLRLTDFMDPQLEMWVKAASIRADELIFPSDRSLLRQIEGHLRLDSRTLSLESVTLELDQGTRPNIRGTITGGSPVQVDLEISSDFVDIGEIVGLWSDKSAAAPRTAKHRPPQASDFVPPQVTIRARAAQGNLYGMHFHKATGTIIPTLQQLSIHPLDFQVGAGVCHAQVLVDFLPDHRSLLRISGHAEDIDALEVYRELLHQKNIVRGRLRGDFYLQGMIGTDYLPSSYGEFQVEINDGVLHKFQSLSKVFSLLNVSQLFAFQLPDMDREGMPFNQLSAHFTLRQGVLGSEDLTIYSNAMNQSYQGTFDLIGRQIDMVMAVQPLGTVDKIVARLPVAGWLLTGEDKALLTAHFEIKGPIDEIRVTPVPITSLSEKTVGLIRRTLGLPFKLIKDPKILWGGESE